MPSDVDLAVKVHNSCAPAGQTEPTSSPLQTAPQEHTPAKTAPRAPTSTLVTQCPCLSGPLAQQSTGEAEGCTGSLQGAEHHSSTCNCTCSSFSQIALMSQICTSEHGKSTHLLTQSLQVCKQWGWGRVGRRVLCCAIVFCVVQGWFMGWGREALLCMPDAPSMHPQVLQSRSLPSRPGCTRQLCRRQRMWPWCKRRWSYLPIHQPRQKPVLPMGPLRTCCQGQQALRQQLGLGQQ